MTTKKLLTLCMVYSHDSVLLGMKKRGVGEGKWNGFGGKVHEGETIEEAAHRELQEEAMITASRLEKIGELDFVWEHKPDEVWEVTVFKTDAIVGEPQETDEMRPQWFKKDQIPFDKMWPDDVFWVPLFLDGKKFKGSFTMAKGDNLLTKELHEVRDNF